MVVIVLNSLYMIILVTTAKKLLMMVLSWLWLHYNDYDGKNTHRRRVLPRHWHWECRAVEYMIGEIAENTGIQFRIQSFQSLGSRV